MNYRPRPDNRAHKVIGSTTGLVIIALAIGLVVAASLGAVAWLIASALHHAANS